MGTVRTAELDLARARIDRALTGDGGVLWISGPAGIGKSVLVASMLEDVDPSWSVVALEGAVHESTMSWSGVSQLVHRMRAHLDAVKPSHRQVIEAMLDVTSGETPDRFAAAVSVHGLVSQAAEISPVLIVVEDHHWLDPDSARILDFVGRRLDGLRAMIVLTTRDEAVDGDQIRLGPMQRDQAVAVLVGLGLATVSAQHLVEQIGGHPFALAHAARTLSENQRSGADPIPVPFPMSADDLPTALARTIEALPEPTRKALHVLAAAGVLGRGWRTVMECADVPLADLAPAENSGVIAIGADSLRFTHPLFRAAVYAHATPGERRISHLLLSRLERDLERSLWHESRSIVGHDDDVARRLAEVAEQANSSGAFSSAFEAWRRAGELTSAVEQAAAYEILAAEAALHAGNNAPSREIIDRLRPLESSDASVVRLAASYEARAGHADQAYTLFMRAATLLEQDRPDHAAHAFLDAARTTLRVGQLHLVADALGRFERMSTRVGSTSAHQMAHVLRTLIDNTAGGPIAPFMEAVSTLVPASGPISGDLSFLADSVALGLAYRHERDAAVALVERLRTAAADQNLPSIIPLLDTAKACALNSVDLPGCMIAAANAVDWADAIGQPNLATGALGYLGNVQAALGDPGVFASSARIGALDTAHGRVSERLMRGFYWITMGQPEPAIEELLPLHEWAAGEMKIVLFWQGDLGEAAARSGRLDLAREVTDQLHAFNQAFPNPWLKGAAARIEGLIADVDDCGAWFDISTKAFAAADIRLAEARSELIWGERLRRARRRGEARPHLRRAHTLFEQLGAGRWIERCEQELIAAGDTATPTDHSRDAERVLTPQELQIARLSVAGHSNRDIGATMFISARTVETHLSAIYRKLGIKNRAALAAAATSDPALRTTGR